LLTLLVDLERGKQAASAVLLSGVTITWRTELCIDPGKDRAIGHQAGKLSRMRLTVNARRFSVCAWKLQDSLKPQ